MNTHTLQDDHGFLTYIEEDHGFCVVMLSVKRGFRMQGIAGKLLAKLITISDRTGKGITLSVVPLDHGPETLPFGLLRDFYMRRGFVDPGGYTQHLVRYPKKVVNENEAIL